MATTQPRIVIIGGGPSGLVLLLTLIRRGIPATLFERDADRSSRAHLGGTLDLRWETGQRALRENGLQDVFIANSREDLDFMTVTDSSANILLRTPEGKPKPEESRPEIDRTVLRRILYEAIPAEHIKWGHAFASARPLGNGQHEVTFANGATVISDILVGADGAHSRVRALVSPGSTPTYTGISAVEVSLTAAAAAAPDMADVRALIGRGTLMSLEGGHMLGGQLNGEGRVRSFAMLRAAEGWTLPADTAGACAALRDAHPGWAPVLLKMFGQGDTVEGVPIVRPLYTLPVGHRWDHVDGVTLIGDAAHLMPPFAGMGVNLAMLDALECGLALVDVITKGAPVAEREAAVAHWEETMFAQAATWGKMTTENMEGFFGKDAPASMLEKLQKYMGLAPVSREK